MRSPPRTQPPARRRPRRTDRNTCNLHASTLCPSNPKCQIGASASAAPRLRRCAASDSLAVQLGDAWDSETGLSAAASGLATVTDLEIAIGAAFLALVELA